MRSCVLHLNTLKTLAALCLLIAFVGCHKQDEPSAVKGRVSVIGGDASGVTVELYEEPVFNDASVWTRTAATPAVGFRYPLHAAFDWRAEQGRLRASTATGADGKFEMSGLADGAYVIIARKQGFGWSRPTSLAVRGGTEDVGVISLRADVPVGSGTVITGDTTWSAGGHIVLQRNLVVDAGATLTIRPGAVLRIGDAGRITVFGSLHVEGTADSFVIITSDQLVSPGPLDWGYINFVPGGAGAEPPFFRYCALRYSEDGVRSSTAGGLIEYCYLSSGGAFGMNLTGTGSAGTEDSVVIRHCVIEKIPVAARAVNVWSTGFVFEHNAVFDCRSYALQMEFIRHGAVFCNWFRNCGSPEDSTAAVVTGVTFSNDVRQTEVSRNEFQWSWFAVSLGSYVDSTTHIHHNRFYRMNRVVNVGVTEEHRSASYPNFNYNCIEQCDYYNIYIGSCLVNNMAIDARNTYWGTTSDARIRERFRDCNDVAANPPCPCIVYQPILMECPASGVGICED